MGELTLPVYFKILGWAGAAIMVFAAVGIASYVRAINSRFIEAFPLAWSRTLISLFPEYGTSTEVNLSARSQDLILMLEFG
jgi:hypothetical protein